MQEARWKEEEYARWQAYGHAYTIASALGAGSGLKELAREYRDLEDKRAMQLRTTLREAGFETEDVVQAAWLGIQEKIEEARQQVYAVVAQRDRPVEHRLAEILELPTVYPLGVLENDKRWWNLFLVLLSSIEVHPETPREVSASLRSLRKMAATFGPPPSVVRTNAASWTWLFFWRELHKARESARVWRVRTRVEPLDGQTDRFFCESTGDPLDGQRLVTEYDNILSHMRAEARTCTSCSARAGSLKLTSFFEADFDRELLRYPMLWRRADYDRVARILEGARQRSGGGGGTGRNQGGVRAAIASDESDPDADDVSAPTAGKAPFLCLVSRRGGEKEPGSQSVFSAQGHTVDPGSSSAGSAGNMRQRVHRFRLRVLAITLYTMYPFDEPHLLQPASFYETLAEAYLRVFPGVRDQIIKYLKGRSNHDDNGIRKKVRWEALEAQHREVRTVFENHPTLLEGVLRMFSA